MCGDQCQLPPTVSNEEAKSEGAELSLFERLVHAGATPHLLDTQYRMHPAISEFPRGNFYDGRLVDGIGAADRPPLDGFAWPDPNRPVCLVAGKGGERKDGDSFQNPKEVEKCRSVADGFVKAGLLPHQVGGAVERLAKGGR